jgi:hypothetical protein
MAIGDGDLMARKLSWGVAPHRSQKSPCSANATMLIYVRARMAKHKIPQESLSRRNRKLPPVVAIIVVILLPVLVASQGCIGSQGCGDGHGAYCSPGYSYRQTSPTCCPCAPGTWQSICGFMASCSPCSPGTYLPGFGGKGPSSCIPCTPGYYMPSAGSSFCLLCGVGTYNPSTGSSSAGACLSCPAGTYNSLTGSSSLAACLPCLAGTYNPSTGSSFCLPCATGTYFPLTGSSSAEACIRCPAGTYNSLTGSSSLAACLPCLAGTYNPSTGSSLCLPCLAGTYSTLAGSSSSIACLPCAEGTYSSFAGSPYCLPCAPGTFSSVIGQALCAPCPPGTYGPTHGSYVCEPCPPGSFCPSNRTVVGIPCPAGTYCPSGADAPSVCPTGSYCQPEQSAPAGCPAGTYGSLSSLTSKSQCTVCPPGTSSGTGAPSCSSDLCIPNPFNIDTFHCYTTAGKVGIILSYAASLFSAIFFPFKMRMIYTRRKAKLLAVGVQPTLKRIVFFRAALGRAVSLQPLITCSSSNQPAVSEQEVALWLQEQGFGEFEDAFVTNKIDGRAIVNLSKEDLEDLGVKLIGKRAALVAAIVERFGKCAASKAAAAAPVSHGAARAS